jgi:hypothetical protein
MASTWTGLIVPVVSLKLIVQARDDNAGTLGKLYLVDAAFLHRGGQRGGEEVGAGRG